MFHVWLVSVEIDRLKEIQSSIEKATDFSLAWSHSSFFEAIEKAKQEQPEFILVNIELFENGNVEITQSIRDAFPHAKIIALASNEEPHVIINALIKGADWYLYINQKEFSIVESLRELINGKTFLSWKVARYFTEHLRLNHSLKPIYLTDRERAIILDIEAGYTYQETADNLGVSIHTVHKQVKKIFKKLKVRKKKDALEVARKKDLL